MREIVNALFHQNRTGCQWASLPHDLPPGCAAYHCFGLWRDDGTDQSIHDLLRGQARERAGRAEDPAAVAGNGEDPAQAGPSNVSHRPATEHDSPYSMTSPASSWIQ